MRKDAELRERTKQFALRVIRVFQALPKTGEAQVIGKQLLRSGTSVAANYREATRGRSPAEVRSKLGIVEQELDESLLWLELLVESGVLAAEKLEPLMQETDELIRIIVTSITRLKNRK
ncbi:MAG: four helix bundle protein [Planctomycetota bacterium]